MVEGLTPYSSSEEAELVLLGHVDGVRAEVGSRRSSFSILGSIAALQIVNGFLGLGR